MQYIIKNTETGKYVARPGSKRSYTTDVPGVRIFTTRAAAEAELCPDNEIVQDLRLDRDVLGPALERTLNESFR